MSAADAPRLVLLAAGRSSRYGTPKQLAPLGPDGASLTAYTVVDALRAGFGRVVLVTSREIHPLLEAHLERHLGPNLPLDWAFQELDDLPPKLAHLAAARRKPWGTAQAILAARHHLPTVFGIANADDWYGPEAHRSLVEALASIPAAGEPGPAPLHPCPAVAVGYPMAATLSPSGGVSRGWISADDDGVIQRVVELRDVRAGGAGQVLGVDPEGAPVAISSHTPASMNLWGFHPCLLTLLEEAFHVFLGESGADVASEFALSTAVDRLLTEERIHLRLIPGGRRWFGVTHPGDGEAVSRRLEALHRDGTYSTPLARTLA